MAAANSISVDRGWISIESVTFGEPVADGEALLAQACDQARQLLSSQHRKDLEVTLQLGDFQIPGHMITVKRMADPQDQVLALADQIAKLVAAQLDRSSLPARLREAAESLSKDTKGFLGKLKAFFQRRKSFSIDAEQKRAASDAGKEMRGVVSSSLSGSQTEGQVSLEKVHEFDEAVQQYAKTKGIHFRNFQIHHGTVRMVFGGAIPSVTPNESDFTQLTYGHSDKYKEAIRHEAVHVMHCTQTRTSAMYQVCAKYGVDSIAQLPKAGLAEIQARVNQFEGGSNYPQLEKLAVSAGGAGGKKDLSEADYRRRLLLGTREIEAAFKNNKLAVNVDASFGDALTGQFGARIGSSTLRGIINMIGLSAGVATPYILIPAVLWNIVRQPEVRQLVGKLLSEEGYHDPA